MRASQPRAVLPYVSFPFVVRAVPLFPFWVLLPAAAVCVLPARPEATLAVLLVSMLTFDCTCHVVLSSSVTGLLMQAIA